MSQKFPFKKEGWKNPNVVMRGQQRTWPHLKQILTMENYSQFSPDVPTYASIEASPSIYPAKKYCDITGFVAPYTDPKTGLRFANATVFYDIKNQLSEEGVEKYLGLRNAKPKTRLQ